MLNDKEKKDMENPTEIPVNEKVIQGAAVAGAIAGFVISGPLVGAAGAIGAGALASQNNKGGEMARASGDVVLAAGERAKKINEKHHVVDKTKKAASTVVKNLKQFDEKHHVVEKTSKGVTKGLEFISEKLKPKPDDR